VIKARKLLPKKYKAGTWSKANMKWTRAEDWAAWGKAKAEEKQSPTNHEWDETEKESDFHQVSEDASA
jgi:hypothetical protein